MNLRVKTSSTAKAPRNSQDRLVVKLSVGLLETFNTINEKYYANREATRQARALKYNVTAKSKLKRYKGQSKNQDAAEPVVPPSPTAKDCNYIVKNSERMNGRYVVSPVNGARSALIGRGSFGKVVSAWDEIAKEFVAIKIVKRKPSFFDQAQVEIEILESLHKSDTRDWNIVEMKNSFVHEGHQCIVFELLQHNLYEVLQYTRFEGLNLKLVRVLARQLLRTLHYLGSRVHGKDSEPIIHCDLKPENILLRKPKKTKIKVIDFGSACFRSYKPHQYIQSRFYRAPEVLFGCPYDCAVDMFSVGCILFELHTGRPLFDGANESEQIDKQLDVLGYPSNRVLAAGTKVDKYFYLDPTRLEWHYRSGREIPNPNKSIEKLLGKRYDENDADSVQFVALVKAMLEWDKDERITPADALRHPFFAEYVARMMPSAEKVAAAAPSSTSGSSSSSNSRRSSASTSSVQYQNQPYQQQVNNVYAEPMKRGSMSDTSTDGGSQPHTPQSSTRDSKFIKGRDSDGDVSIDEAHHHSASSSALVDMTTQTNLEIWPPSPTDRKMPSLPKGYSSGSDNDSEAVKETQRRRRSAPLMSSKNRDTRGVSPKRHLELFSDVSTSHKRSRRSSEDEMKNMVEFRDTSGRMSGFSSRGSSNAASPMDTRSSDTQTEVRELGGIGPIGGSPFLTKSPFGPHLQQPLTHTMSDPINIPPASIVPPVLQHHTSNQPKP